MKVSFFETVRYLPPQALPPEWPVPAGAYDPEAGARAYRGMIGAGVLDLSLHTPGSAELEPLTRALELFGRKVLPRIQEI